ncbi:MAG: hypothetical protein WBZ36_14785 [Candidatus Nitrosopolaris sp.]
MVIALPILLLSINVVFNYSLFQTFAQNDLAAGAKTTTYLIIERGSNPILQISSNKQTYKPGETIVITVKNNGKYTLEFPDSVLGLTIRDTRKGWVTRIRSNLSTKAKRIKNISVGSKGY